MDMKTFNDTFPNLVAQGGDPAMIGRKCRFKGESCYDGEMAKRGIFEIIGYQVNWCKERCYRVKCIHFEGEPYNDPIGRVMSLDRCDLIEEGTNDTPSV